jgi:uncharacterized protein
MSQESLPSEGVILAETVDPAIPIPTPPKPWGIWTTLAFSFGVVVAINLAAVPLIVVFMAMHPLGPKGVDEFAESGLFLSLTTWLAAPVGLAFIGLLVKLRKQWTIREYLSLHRVSTGTVFAWIAATVVFIAMVDATTWLLGLEVVPHVVIDMYRTAGSVPLLLATLLIAAPVFEETFFRGFMFLGLQQSKLGNVGAILITALAWSALHMQYDAYQMTLIFGNGILLGLARAKSNSVLLTILMHSLMNLIATIELLLCIY